MPTNANTDGLKKNKYLIMRKGRFVFSGMQTGRDMAIRVGLYNSDKPALISPAYITFSVSKDKRDRILPEYLNLQFKRSESDRLGWFYSDGSIRSNLDWDRFCDMELNLSNSTATHRCAASHCRCLPLHGTCQTDSHNCTRETQNTLPGLSATGCSLLIRQCHERKILRK